MVPDNGFKVETIARELLFPANYLESPDSLYEPLETMGVGAELIFRFYVVGNSIS